MGSRGSTGAHREGWGARVCSPRERRAAKTNGWHGRCEASCVCLHSHRGPGGRPHVWRGGGAVGAWRGWGEVGVAKPQALQACVHTAGRLLLQYPSRSVPATVPAPPAASVRRPAIVPAVCVHRALQRGPGPSVGFPHGAAGPVTCRRDRRREKPTARTARRCSFCDSSFRASVKCRRDHRPAAGEADGEDRKALRADRPRAAAHVLG